ncbi:hypothetical protein [Rheinheimera sp.]|uniref:hypothetical protein n=1 Tax=Rheinheimera sp. TaxID=1869214 RepID=UPI002354F658|nr:hypothetical protein [Rheinheimera sp.]
MTLIGSTDFYIGVRSLPKRQFEEYSALGVLYIGIRQYGSFISGLQIIHGQVRTVSGYLGDRAGAPIQSSKVKPRVRRNGESLARLLTLFVKVQKGELSVDEAMEESERLFGYELNEAVDFKKNSNYHLNKLRFSRNNYRYL